MSVRSPTLAPPAMMVCNFSRVDSVRTDSKLITSPFLMSLNSCVKTEMLIFQTSSERWMVSAENPHLLQSDGGQSAL